MKTVSATEAKNRLGSLLAELSDGAGAIVIENHGRPRAVIISPEEWATLNDARERMRRQEAWERIRELAEEVSARNADLSQEEVDAIADDVGREAIANVMERARRQREERSG